MNSGPLWLECGGTMGGPKILRPVLKNACSTMAPKSKTQSTFVLGDARR